MKTITEIVEKHLCLGCGLCAYIEPERFRMIDIESVGRRPVVKSTDVVESGLAFKLCPGISLSHDKKEAYRGDIVEDMFAAWGPVMSVYEGYASDEEIRFNGSSGGAATALALFGIEQFDMSGVLHTAGNREVPYKNKTVYSKNKEGLLETLGSRYAPSCPCEKLDLIENAENPSVFIGKPCDVAAVKKAAAQNKKLEEKIGITIAFFCAGVPSTYGNLELLKQQGLSDIDNLKSLKFRGKGWPGKWVAKFKNNSGESFEKSLTYAESWGFLQKYRQWRCYICPDHTGEFADIAVGDPWYRDIKEKEKGNSLIIARTERGKKYLMDAADKGFITILTEDLSLFPRSQPNLLKTKGNIWGRLLAMKLAQIPAPDFDSFKLFDFWMKNLSFKEKIKSLLGTFKRVHIKRLKKKQETLPVNDHR